MCVDSHMCVEGGTVRCLRTVISSYVCGGGDGHSVGRVAVPCPKPAFLLTSMCLYPYMGCQGCQERSLTVMTLLLCLLFPPALLHSCSRPQLRRMASDACAITAYHMHAVPDNLLAWGSGEEMLEH